ncbi:LuxR C-terminal-related transcriptional regulator [Streptomyces fimicarius]|uniref:LuxR C-terminal-related transcriptional regulator n=1 Tax=Streptomyces griseus TaxID=1911 RepID=UPI0035DBFC1A
MCSSPERAASRSSGEVFPSPEAKEREARGRQERRESRGPLTDREKQVPQLVANGHSNRDAATALFIGDASVKTQSAAHLRQAPRPRPRPGLGGGRGLPPPPAHVAPPLPVTARGSRRASSDPSQ